MPETVASAIEKDRDGVSVVATAHRPSSGDFFPALDGLRGIAVLCVVLRHTLYFNPAHPLQKALFFLSQSGRLGVPIFFVLSGFLIAHTCFKVRGPFDVAAYAARRTAKIVPPFLLSLVVCSVVLAWWKGVAGIPLTFLANVVTLPHFSRHWLMMSPGHWSLMVEMHFYVALPLVYFGLRRFTPWADWITFALFFTVPLVVRLATHLPLTADYNDWVHHAVVFPRALDNFAFGILFAVLYGRYRAHPAMPRWAGKLTLAGAIVLPASFVLHAWLEYLACCSCSSSSSRRRTGSIALSPSPR
jgi:peptidoglycan/LPS O-acetylase OafA/YrhL